MQKAAAKEEEEWMKWMVKTMRLCKIHISQNMKIEIIIY